MMNTFKLFVCGNSEKNRKLFSSIKMSLEKLFLDKFEFDVINLIENPEMAVCDNILVTPTLVRIEPEPVKRFVGDISNESVLKRLLCDN